MMDCDTGNGYAHDWATTNQFNDFALVCCGKPHMTLSTDPETFSLTQRVARVGPVTIDELTVGSDFAMNGGDACDSYRIVLLQAGHSVSSQSGRSIDACAGTAVIYAPEGPKEVRWAGGTRLTSVKIDRGALDDALADALGLPGKSPIQFTPVMPMHAASTRSWVAMVLHFKEQLFRPDSLLHQPLVTAPVTDSLLRGLLLTADHPHRGALVSDQPLVAPRTIRLAVDVIESEAHLPLTAASIAARCHVSVRSLQDSFRRHVGISPMAYLRQVRLRRAHEELLDADPSTSSVASSAYRWGFTNLGRFAAAHAARYRECPAETLKRVR